MVVLDEDFKYIDLFAGIGGFHSAMNKFSPKSQCVMASEIDPKASKVYEKNFGIKPEGDVRKVDPESIGQIDVICGGFPCQTFSKAGKQVGLGDPRGTLFQEIIRIATFYSDVKKRPKFLLLENVHNLVNHDKGKTWRTIKNAIKEAGYNVVEQPIIIGPKDIGIPQIRDRAIIVAVREDIYNGTIDFAIQRKKRNTTSIDSVLEKKKSAKYLEEFMMTDKQIKLLECWDDFYQGIKEKVLGTPVWSDEFGLTYDLKELDEEGNYKIPEWKQDYIQWNRDLYLNNKDFIDAWYKKWNIKDWTFPTDRKFEWQCGEHCKSIWETIVQFRTSGVRVKRPTESPTLVTLDHIPAIAWKKRFLTVREVARLQSFPDDYVFDESKADAYKQLGNAVNVDVIEYVFRTFVKYIEDK